MQMKLNSISNLSDTFGFKADSVYMYMWMSFTLVYLASSQRHSVHVFWKYECPFFIAYWYHSSGIKTKLILFLYQYFICVLKLHLIWYDIGIFLYHISESHENEIHNHVSNCIGFLKIIITIYKSWSLNKRKSRPAKRIVKITIICITYHIDVPIHMICIMYHSGVKNTQHA